MSSFYWEMATLTIGVLGIQGAIEDHESSLLQAAKELGITIKIKRLVLPEDLENVDGVVMPGGESTAMTLIGKKDGLVDELNERLRNGLPTFGTCAGAILLSKQVKRTPDSSPQSGVFPILDMEIYRNGYGRQRESFSTTITLDQKTFHGIFIRAPVIGTTGGEVEVLSRIEGDPVFVKQGNIFATTFHPELSDNTKIHKMFLKAILDLKKVKGDT